MKKLTRKTFSRKFVAVGLSSFLGVGLVSTGFAAWVMSSNATDETNSNVTVATLSDVSMSFENVSIDGDKSIIFGAEKDDVTGRLISDGVDDACLVVVIKGTISNAMQLGKLSAKLDLPVSVQNAVTAGYLIAPDSKNGVDLYKKATDSNPQEFRHDNLAITFSGENNNTATFSYTLEFKWGDKFQGMNPSVYYDYDFANKNFTFNGMTDKYNPEFIGQKFGSTQLDYPVLGKYVSNEDMTSQMRTFRETLSGSAEHLTTAKLDYKLTLTATAESSVN